MAPLVELGTEVVNIEVEVESGDLLEKARELTEANRLAKGEQDRESAVVKQGEEVVQQARQSGPLRRRSGRVRNAFGGTDLPEPDELAANKKSGIVLGWFFLEENFLEAGGEGIIEYYDKSYKSIFKEVSGLLITQVENSAIALTRTRRGIGYRTARIQWETSENCGGQNDLTQLAELHIATIHSGSLFITIRVEGAGEQESTGFERFAAIINDIETGQLASSPGGGLGCAPSAPLVFADPIDATRKEGEEEEAREGYLWTPHGSYGVLSVKLPSASKSKPNEIILICSTGDSLYHDETSYYQFDFKLSSSYSSDWDSND